MLIIYIILQCTALMIHLFVRCVQHADDHHNNTLQIIRCVLKLSPLAWAGGFGLYQLKVRKH